MTRRHPLALAIIAMTALTAAGCGEDATSSADAGSATDSSSTGAASALEEPLDSSLVDSVSANDASADEIAAALGEAGVPASDRWAREIEEYRPYADDPDLPHLRDELAKYDPPAGVVDRIVEVLEP